MVICSEEMSSAGGIMFDNKDVPAYGVHHDNNTAHLTTTVSCFVTCYSSGHEVNPCPKRELIFRAICIAIHM